MQTQEKELILKKWQKQPLTKARDDITEFKVFVSLKVSNTLQLLLFLVRTSQCHA